MILCYSCLHRLRQAPSSNSRWWKLSAQFCALGMLQLWELTCPRLPTRREPRGDVKSRDGKGDGQSSAPQRQGRPQRSQPGPFPHAKATAREKTSTQRRETATKKTKAREVLSTFFCVCAVLRISPKDVTL